LSPALLRSAAVALAALGLAASSPKPAPFQFEVLGASSDWVVLRENVRAKGDDPAPCKYPGLDPSEQVGVSVRFVKLTPEAKRGKLFELDPAAADKTLPVYAPGPAESCTSAADVESHWRDVRSHAESLGVTLAQKAPAPAVLGAAVPSTACVLIGDKRDTKSCQKSYPEKVAGGPIKVAVSLSAVPEAPDLKTCQFVGQRFEAAIQVDGLDFGSVGGSGAPGGFANHYDCRSQEFEPLRLYKLDGTAVLMGGFRGTNMADRAAHPFLAAP